MFKGCFAASGTGCLGIVEHCLSNRQQWVFQQDMTLKKPPRADEKKTLDRSEVACYAS